MSGNSRKINQDEFERALSLRDRGRRREAVALLLRIRRRAPQDASVCAMLGQILWDDGQLARAALWFRKATLLAPRSELASLGLFHVLWELEQRTLAIAEMKRFCQLSSSDDYDEIRAELAEELVASHQ